MAAGKAAPSATGATAQGTPAQVPYSVSYTLTSTNPGSGASANIGGTTAVILHGPGVITSIQFVTTTIADIGFQVVNFSSRGTVPLTSASIGTQNTQGAGTSAAWLTQSQTVNPAMGPGYVYPIQEIINTNPLAFLETPAALSGAAAPGVFPTGGGTVTSGEVFTTQTSFANAYLITGTRSIPSGGYNVASLTYTYFQPLPFTDEARIILSPGILWGNQYGYAPNPQVALTVNALVA